LKSASFAQYDGVMDKRFFSLSNLTEDEAIALLDTPHDRVGEDDSRYSAASHLVNFPSDKSIQALIRAIEQTDSALDNRIVRRKAIETLGRLQAKQALPVIRNCLSEADCYTVENAVWAIGEIGTQDPLTLEAISRLLDQPNQTYRVIIHTLTKLKYQPALDRIQRFTTDRDPLTQSAALASLFRFTGDSTYIEQVTDFLQHPNVMARRLCIQDLIDAQSYEAIPKIVRCPVSLIFRLRGIRLLADAGVSMGEVTYAKFQTDLEKTLYDHPETLDLVHVYQQPMSLAALIQELYEPDFGRCYLATQTILEQYADVAPTALVSAYEAEAKNDYGAHFHVVKLLGWLKYAPAYDLLVEALHNRLPQYQKSRAAAAIALGELGDPRAIPELRSCLNTTIWDLKYAALMALEKLGDRQGHVIAAQDEDWLVQAKASSVATPV
jgi:bilin biosynthesis protein